MDEKKLIEFKGKCQAKGGYWAWKSKRELVCRPKKKPRHILMERKND